MSSSPRAPWSLASLKLPKAVESDSRAEAVRLGLRAGARSLWSGGALAVPTAPWVPVLVSVLERAQREAGLVRGLELIEKTLEHEARGIALADARSGAQRGSRVSRLVLVSNDGTERFYRQVERLLGASAARVLVIRVDANAEQLAAVVPDAAGVVRAVMLEHKELVASVLLALYAAS